MKRIMFVCTGNICRSPTAEAVFRHYVEQRGCVDDFEVRSSGTHGYHVGDAPDERAQAVAHQHGVLMKDLRAKKFTKQDFDDFDYIVAMDEGHLDILKKICPPNNKARLLLFMDYVPHLDFSDVPDPYYGDRQGFENVFDIIEAGVEFLFEKIEASS